jgi:TetR/AcrR family transcriptional repressor of nem operon
MEEHIESFVARVAATLQGDSDSDKQALVAVSAMIGALALSRAITDTKRSDEVLRTVRDSLIESIGNDA